MENVKNKARRNIDLLEKADEIALSHLSNKILKPEYRKVLTNQDEQLKYYLNTYKEGKDLPTRIATEYAFPRFFYYDINSKKKGKVQKRIKLDSKMFAKFMKNNAKRELAKAQGIPIDKIVRIKKERKQPLLKLTDTQLKFDFLERPKFDEFDEFKGVIQDPLKSKITPQRVKKFIPKSEITFIVPKPLPSKIKDIRKNYKNIEDTISSLFYDSENIIPDYTPNTMLGNLASLSIIKRYGGNCIVHDVMKTIPDWSPGSLNFGIYVSIPFKPDVIDYQKLGEQLADCKRRNVPIIMFPIYMKVKFKDDNDRYITEGHANLWIYRPVDKTIELFEPNGYTFAGDDEIGRKIEAAMLKIIKQLKPYLGDVVYGGPGGIFSDEGFQSLESQVVGDTAKEGKGYCIMWSAFFMEMVYLNPDKTSREIADDILLISGEDPQYLKQVIRGYVMNMEKILQKIVKDVAELNFAYSENNSILYLKIHSKMGIFADWLLTMAEDRNTIVFEKDAQKKYNLLSSKIQKLTNDIANATKTTPKYLIKKYKKELEEAKEEYAILEDELNPGGESYYYERNRPQAWERTAGHQMLNDEY